MEKEFDVEAQFVKSAPVNDPQPTGAEGATRAPVIDWEFQLSEMKQSLFCYFSSRLDSTKVTVREFSFKVILGLFLSSLMYGTLFVAICFMMYGMVLGINAAVGMNPAFGYLATGGFFILLAILSIKITLFKLRKNSLQQKVRQYAEKY